MEELKIQELKCALKNHADKETVIIPLLREIGAKLLTDYEIRVGAITIEPLRVEPYLFKDGAFEDKFIHKDNGIYGARQRNRCGKFYIHSGYSGVDIVLSDGDDYAFSFLIKNSRILLNGQVTYPFVKQIRAASVLKENGIPMDCDEVVLYRKGKPNNSIVFRTIRNGLASIVERKDFSKEQQKQYNQLLIASFIELKEHTSREFDFSTGFGGNRAVVEYLKDYKKSHPDVTYAELDKRRMELYPNGTKTLFVKEFGE